jgi:hypothetical protein
MKLIISLFSIQFLLATCATARRPDLVSIAPTKNPTSSLRGLTASDVGKVAGTAAVTPVTNIATTLPKGAPAFDTSTLTYSFAGKGGTTGVKDWVAPAGAIPLDSKILSVSVLCKKKSQGGPWDSASLTTIFVNDSGATTVMTVKLSPEVVPMEDGAKVTCGLKDAQGTTLNTDETLLTRSVSGNRMTLTGSIIL